MKMRGVTVRGEVVTVLCAGMPRSLPEKAHHSVSAVCLSTSNTIAMRSGDDRHRNV
jgi:hypothetical protein